MAMWIRSAVCTEAILLLLNLTINWHKSRDGFLWQISKYFLLRKRTPAIIVVGSS